MSGTVNPKMADRALTNAKGDRKAAYSRYITLYFRATGSLTPNCDNKDLQEYYREKHG